MTLVLLLAAVTFLAYSNGANDNFKGVASLFGSRTTTYSRAIWWATATTFAGSIVSIVVAQSLLTRFSGKGIVSNQIAGSEEFLLAVALGAGLTVIAATLTGFPISTTHALTGGIVGAGVAAVGSSANLDSLGTGFFMPLAFSPLLAVCIAILVYGALRVIRRQSGLTRESCICVGESEVLAVPQTNSVATLTNSNRLLSVSSGEFHECVDRYAGSFLGVKVQTAVDGAHFLSAGMVSFARGLNDTPKIAAMLLVVQALDIRHGMIAIAAAMAIGGLLSARRVAQTMSHRITRLSPGQGLSANLSTALLVILATRYGLPVSTTHVSVGSIFGIAVVSRQANVRVVVGIVLSWVITLPCAALISGVTYWVAHRSTP
jgi:inorganic phosphate transporter, PiT family